MEATSLPASMPAVPVDSPLKDAVSAALSHVSGATEHMVKAAQDQFTNVNFTDYILSFRNLCIMVAISVLMEAFKRTLEIANVKEGKTVHMVMPYLPLALGIAAVFIPGVFEPAGAPIGMKIVIGLALGGVTGQVWKILKSKLEVIQDKV